MSALGDYLADYARGEWNHGDGEGPKRDCCTFLADWLVLCGYPDPMADLRDRYRTEAEATALAAKPGLLRLAAPRFRKIGLQPTKEPIDGDVAIIKRATVDGLDATCAIRSTDRWITPLERGLMAYEGDEIMRAWRVQWARP